MSCIDESVLAGYRFKRRLFTETQLRRLHRGGVHIIILYSHDRSITHDGAIFD